MHVSSQFRIIYHQVQAVHLDVTKRKNPRKSLELKQKNFTNQFWVPPALTDLIIPLLWSNAEKGFSVKNYQNAPPEKYGFGRERNNRPLQHHD